MSEIGTAVFTAVVGALIVTLMGLAMFGLPHQWLVEASPAIVIFGLMAAVGAMAAGAITNAA